MVCYFVGLIMVIVICGIVFGIEYIKVLCCVMGDDNVLGEVVFMFDGDEVGQKVVLCVFIEDDCFNVQIFVVVVFDGFDLCDLCL